MENNQENGGLTTDQKQKMQAFWYSIYAQRDLHAQRLFVLPYTSQKLVQCAL